MSEQETVAGLRERVGRTVASVQRDAAEMSAAAEESRDLGRHDRALFAQVLAARLHRDVATWLEWLSDDVFMSEWCDRINRGRREDEPPEDPPSPDPMASSGMVIYATGLARDVA